MNKKHHALVSAIAALLVTAFAAPSIAQDQKAGSATQIQLAQNAKQGDEYLPPWQRGQSGQQPQGDVAPPQRITPRQSDAPRERDYDNAGRRGYDDDTTTASTYRDGPPARYEKDYDDPPPPHYGDDSYSTDEIIEAGHGFFGGVSKALAQVVEHAFAKQGRPNGYILGEEAGGAIVAGLRYGEGKLYTKNAGSHRVYWQGPSLGYDFGAEGSKTLILVYNLRDVDALFHRFAGVDGSAYFVGGVGITFQTYDDVVLAPIRSGVGLRLGANVGYLKYTRQPTWNPF